MSFSFFLSNFCQSVYELQKLAAADGDAANALRQKMQQRVSLLLSAGQGFEPAYQSELEALGLLFS